MSKQTEFINKIAPIIQRYAKQYGFKTCSGIIAQACLESAWGTSDKAAHHNYFGLKYRNGRVGCHIGYFKSGSKEEYKVGQITNIIGSWYMFASMEKGVEGYFQFITNGPYPIALLKAADNPRNYLSLLKESKYATSSTYVENNMRVVDQYNLTQFDKEEAKEWMATKQVFNVHGGHNKKCPGAHGYFDETTEDRKVKDAVIKYLRQAGHTVYDCTDDDGATASANLRNIVAKCNKHEVAIDISIHFNASAGAGHGSEVWVWKLNRAQNADAVDAANRVVKKLTNLGFTNRGVKENERFYVLKWTNAPAILVEVCFCDNQTDANLYKKLGPDRIGRAIASGILGTDISEPKAEVPKSKKIKAKTKAAIYEITGAIQPSEVTDYVDETSEFYILHGNRFVRKENFDAL
jgi:N-acetylmuramoyl-L-alanine amidase